MVDTIVYVMVIFIDTTVVQNRFQLAAEEATRKFHIEMMQQASRDADKSNKKVYRTKILELYRKEE